MLEPFLIPYERCDVNPSLNVARAPTVESERRDDDTERINSGDVARSPKMRGISLMDGDAHAFDLP